MSAFYRQSVEERLIKRNRQAANTPLSFTQPLIVTTTKEHLYDSIKRRKVLPLHQQQQQQQQQHPVSESARTLGSPHWHFIKNNHTCQLKQNVARPMSRRQTKQNKTNKHNSRRQQDGQHFVRLHLARRLRLWTRRGVRTGGNGKPTATANLATSLSDVLRGDIVI